MRKNVVNFAEKCSTDIKIGKCARGFTEVATVFFDPNSFRPLLTSLRTLYAIPPARADAPAGDTNLARRLARVVAIYIPAALPADSSASSKLADGANGINTYRDKSAPQSSSAAGAWGPGASTRRASPSGV